MSRGRGAAAGRPGEEALPATAQALLGLLALRPWSTYELAQQLRRSLRWFFPRAERGAYSETKRLAQLGLAEASTEYTGRRASTIYRITPAGRASLRRWLGEPSAPVSFESEGLAKVFFADQGSVEQLRAVLAEVRAQADVALGELTAMADEGRRGVAPFPERAHVNALGMRMVADLHRALRAWASWAEGEVSGWASTTTVDAEVGRAAFASLLAELDGGGQPA